jgi:1,4-alpha-glucan branching enzyme
MVLNHEYCHDHATPFRRPISSWANYHFAECKMAVQPSDLGRMTPMGATPAAAGTYLRCWAPSATRIALIPDSSAEPAPGDDLQPLGDESWAGFVADMRDGDTYMFWVEGPDPTAQWGSGAKRDPRARELSPRPSFPGCACVVRDPHGYVWQFPNWRTPEFSDLIIYHLHVGTWRLGAAGRNGTFLDIAAQLPYIAALGVNAIQLLPIQEFESQFSMGYNGVDYFAPEGDYLVAPDALASYTAVLAPLFAQFGGTMPPLTRGIDQLKCLIDLAHAHGIAVIFDLVYNHAGGNFDDASMFFFDCRPRGDNNDSLYFTDQGWAGGLVFAYWNANVRQFLIDNATFFQREYRVDGFRYDEVRVIANHGGRQLCADLTSTLRYTNPTAIGIAEYWDDDRQNAVAPAPAGLGFDAELGDGLRDAVRDLLTQASAGENAAVNLDAVADALAAVVGDWWRLVQCLENQDLTYYAHDGAARVAGLADPLDATSWYGRSRARAAFAILLASRGIPSIFMGQETLEWRLWSDNPNLTANQIDWAAAEADKNRADFHRFTQNMIRARRQLGALRGSALRVSRASNYDRVIVLHRWIEGLGEDAVLVVSFDERIKYGYRIGLPFPGTWFEYLNSDVYDNFPNPAPAGNGGSVFAEDVPQDGFAASASIIIPANGALILVRNISV